MEYILDSKSGSRDIVYDRAVTLKPIYSINYALVTVFPLVNKHLPYTIYSYTIHTHIYILDEATS